VGEESGGTYGQALDESEVGSGVGGDGVALCIGQLGCTLYEMIDG
jgi:hypothetical protein